MLRCAKSADQAMLGRSTWSDEGSPPLAGGIGCIFSASAAGDRTDDGICGFWKMEDGQNSKLQL